MRAPPITIAHVNVARGYRGGERQTELLIRELQNHNVRQVLVARRNEPLAGRVCGAGVEVRAVSSNRLAVAKATAGANVVHVHEGRSVYAAFLRSLRSNVPYIVTRRVDNAIGDHWLAHRAYRRAACVVPVARQIADGLYRYDPLIRLKVIHSSCSGLRASKARSSSIRDRFPGKFLVGHVAALDNRQKAQKLIIQVAEELQYSQPHLQFVLVGGGDDEMMLRSAARGLGNVAFTGFVENVGDYLAAFDMFILPSNREGIGGILLDAMEHGLPVVASRVGGVPEIVHDGQNGLLIEPGQPGQLRSAILRLHQAPDLRRLLGSRGKKLAKAFSAEAMCQQYLSLYRSAVGRSADELSSRQDFYGPLLKNQME